METGIILNEDFHDKLPKEFYFMRELLLSSLGSSSKHWRITTQHSCTLI